jgi:Zn finger protein HypA/HybF involved in hydrogenase expression
LQGGEGEGLGSPQAEPAVFSWGGLVRERQNISLPGDKCGMADRDGECVRFFDKPDELGEVLAKVHEYSLMEQVIAHILAELQKVDGPPQGSSLEVVLRVGALAVHSEAATRQAFEVLVKGTPLEHSRLDLTIEPVVLACVKCGYQGPLPEGTVDPHDPSPLVECPRCGAVSPVQGGRGVEGIELRWE